MSEPDKPTMGQIVDGLGVRNRLDEGDMVTDCLVIVKVIEADGTERAATLWSEGISWLTRSGMLQTAFFADLTSGVTEEHPRDD